MIIMELLSLNPSHPDPGRRGKINLNFYFHTSLCSSKGFMKALKVLKALIKPFEAPQTNMKIKIYGDFYFNTNT